MARRKVREFSYLKGNKPYWGRGVTGRRGGGGARSGRVAFQYIQDLAGRLGVRLDQT